MPQTWRLALKALWAAIQAFVAKYRLRKADADAGAAHQRADSDAADQAWRDQQRKAFDDWQNLSPAERRARLRALDDDGGV